MLNTPYFESGTVIVSGRQPHAYPRRPETQKWMTSIVAFTSLH